MEEEIDYVVSYGRYENYASTGMTLDNLALDANLFLLFPRDGYFYRYKVFAHRRTSSPDNTGEQHINPHIYKQLFPVALQVTDATTSASTTHHAPEYAKCTLQTELPSTPPST